MHRIGSCDVALYIQIGIVVKNMSLEVEHWCEACSRYGAPGVHTCIHTWYVRRKLVVCASCECRTGFILVARLIS